MEPWYEVVEKNIAERKLREKHKYLYRLTHAGIQKKQKSIEEEAKKQQEPLGGLIPHLTQAPPSTGGVLN